MNTTFRTILVAHAFKNQINHQQKLLLLGSCFTEHIGTQLQEYKFDALTNPFGIVYNPLSIAQCLERVTDGNQPFSEDDLFENAGLWHSWAHHGRFSHPNKTEALKGINQAYQEAVEHLKKTDFLLLTFGTAEVFELKETGQLVANNHKMPAAHFTARRLSVSEIVEKMWTVLQTIKAINEQLQVILTVSPVRHLRNGLVENQRSKATLILACEEICKQLDFAQYFPAYELLIDDLRDYRFYAADMLHPSEVAVDYVWQFFSDTFFAENTQRLNERIGKIRSAAQHRPFHPDTEQHRTFVRAQLEVIAQLKQEMPGLDFSGEEAVFTKFASQVEP